jgi:MoaA/NifB/PqqE/SkfB family radical SAM enzyme
MSQNIEEENYKEKYEESLSIEVTNRCNSACSHCFVRAAISECSDLSIDLVREIISEGYHLGYRRLHITGGEPLLWEGLFEALDYAFSLGYKKILINTNGTLLTEDFVNRCSGYHGLSISVSLEGPESFHDRVRGQYSYKRAVLGIEKALDAGNDLYIFATVSKSLLPVLPYFVDEIYKRFPGIKCLTLIQLIRVKDDLFDLSNEVLDPEDFLKLVRMVSLLNIYGHKTEILNNLLAVVVSKLFEIPWIPRVLPLHRPGHLIVIANRNIALSHSTFNSFGKYEPGMIERVLASNEYRTAVAPDETTCPSCGYTKLCKENGMIRPSEWYRDMYPEVPYCKRVLDRAAP